MTLPLQITLRDVPYSEQVEEKIREKVEKLDRFYDRIMRCRVTVEAPHRHHRNGKIYNVCIDITVPGGEVVVNREASQDLSASIRDAFDAARRKLEDYGRKQRGEQKVHESPPYGRISKLFPNEGMFGEIGYGFIKTPDGREIYFHRNSVLEGKFDELEIGMEVQFAEENGIKGPQASTVRIVGKELHHKGEPTSEPSA